MLNPAFDEECRHHAGEQYKAAGVKLQLNVTPTKFEKQDNGKITVTVEPKEGKPYLLHDIDVVLLATGRSPNTKNIGLEEVCLWLLPAACCLRLLQQALDSHTGGHGQMLGKSKAACIM